MRGHGPGQEVLQIGKREVNITAIDPVGAYAVKFVFSDGHDTGIYSWDYLYDLGAKQDANWKSYLARLDGRREARASRDRPGRAPRVGHEAGKTHFGYQQVAEEEKARRVGEVFTLGRRQLRRDERPDVARPAPRVEALHARDERRARRLARARRRLRQRRPRARLRPARGRAPARCG